MGRHAGSDGGCNKIDFCFLHVWDYNQGDIGRLSSGDLPQDEWVMRPPSILSACGRQASGRAVNGDNGMNTVRKLLGLKSAEAAPPVTPVPPDPNPVATDPVIPRPTTAVFGPPKEFTKPAAQIRYGIHSDIGGRENNEDAALALLISAEMTGGSPPLGIFIVADGMGGHQDGERASSLTARIVAQTILEDVAKPQLNSSGPSGDQAPIAEVLTAAIAAANAAVREQVPGGGTTVTAVVIRGDMAHIAHVGDSRAYLFDDGDLEQITRDHSMAERLREIGQSENLPLRNVLYKAVGASDHVEADSIIRKLPPSSRLLLCSDGMWDSLGDDTLRFLIEQSLDPQEACDRLVSTANTNKVEDNVTALIVQMPD